MRRRPRGALPSAPVLLGLRLAVLVVAVPALVGADDDRPARPVLLRPPGRRARPLVGRVRQRHDLVAPRRHAHRDAARLRDRHGGRHRDGVLAGARPAAGRRRAPLHPGGERAAAGHPGPHLRALAGPRHLVEGGARLHAGLLRRVLQRLPGRARGQPGHPRQRAHARHGRARPAAPRLPALGPRLGVLEPAHGRGLRPGRGGGGRVSRGGGRDRLPDRAGRGRVRHRRRVLRHADPDRVRAGHRRAGQPRRAPPAALAAVSGRRAKPEGGNHAHPPHPARCHRRRLRSRVRPSRHRRRAGSSSRSAASRCSTTCR